MRSVQGIYIRQTSAVTLLHAQSTLYSQTPRSEQLICVAYNMGNKCKLTYFPVIGVAEPIRFLLAYLKIDFEDFRFDEDDWPAIKTTTPWGKSPILEINGDRVCQSIAITRYLGRRAGLSGNDAWEDLKIDEIVGVIDDFRVELAKYGYEEDASRKEALKGPLVNEIVPFYMGKLDSLLKNKKYLANGKLSWADIWFSGISDYLTVLLESELTKGYPNVQSLKDTVFALPGIKEWVATRPADR